MALADTPDFWWKLDETSGTTAYNSGSYGTASDYNATVTKYGTGSTQDYAWLGSGESWGSGGITGGIDLQQDTESEFYYLQAANMLPFGSQTKVTFAAWVIHDGSNNDGRIFQQGNSYYSSGHQVMFGQLNTDDFWSRINGDSYSTAGSHYPTDTKTHVVCVIDYTLSGNELKVYLNGGTTPDLQYSLPDSAIFSNSTYTNGTCLLGAAQGASASLRGTPWFGALCDIRIWLDAATGAEADAIYQNTHGGGPVVLSVANTSHAHSVENLALVQAHVLDSVANTSHSHSVQNLDLVQAHVLDSVANTSHSHSVENLALVQAHVLDSVANTSHAHTAENITLSLSVLLEVANTSHAHTVQNLDLVQAHVLEVADAIFAHVAESPGLVQAHVLEVADASHAHTADEIELFVGELISALGDLGIIVQTDGRTIMAAAESRAAAVTSDARTIKIIH